MVHYINAKDPWPFIATVRDIQKLMGSRLCIVVAPMEIMRTSLVGLLHYAHIPIHHRNVYITDTR